MVAPGDGKLVRLRETTLKEERGLTSWCLVCRAGRGRPGEERRREPDSRRRGSGRAHPGVGEGRVSGAGGGRGGGQGCGGGWWAHPCRCLPPSGWKQGHRSMWVLGCLHTCSVGAETGCSVSFSPPHHLRCTIRVQAGSSVGGGCLASLENALFAFKQLLGSGERAADPWLQQAGLGFPFPLQEFPSEGCRPHSPLCSCTLSQLALEQIT